MRALKGTGEGYGEGNENAKTSMHTRNSETSTGLRGNENTTG